MKYSRREDPNSSFIEINVETPAGDSFLVVATGADHVHICFGGRREGPPIVIRGVKYSGGIHAFRQPDGTVKAEAGAHGVSRSDWTNYAKSHPSRSARTAIENKVREVAEWYWRECSGIAIEAERARLKRELETIDEKIDEASAALKALQDSRWKLADDLLAIDRPDVQTVRAQ